MVKYLLDTNVSSELRKKNCNENVLSWFNGINPEDIFLSVFSIGEIEKGIVKSKDKIKKQVLRDWLENKILTKFKNRIIGFDIKKATVWGNMIGQNRTLPILDSLICATAIANNLTLVTRNTKDFKNIKEIKLFNPWKD